MFKSVKSWYAETTSEMKKKAALRSLSKKLARNLELAKQHSSAGLKAGDPVYKELWVKSTNAISEFCVDYKTGTNEVFIQVPGLQNLRVLAQADESVITKRPGVGFIITLLVAGSMLVTIWFSVLERLHYLVIGKL